MGSDGLVIGMARRQRDREGHTGKEGWMDGWREEKMALVDCERWKDGIGGLRIECWPGDKWYTCHSMA